MSIRSWSSETARWVLVAGWFFFFTLNLAILLFLYFGSWIYSDNFRAGLSQLSSLYAPYLGAILAFYFSSRAREAGTGATAGIAFALAAVGSVIWNVVILTLLVRVVFLWGTIEEAARDMLFFGSTLSWLIAPAMGFYFANPSLAPGEKEKQ